MGHQTHYRGRYTVSTDPTRLDLDVVHDYLSRESYWTAGIPRGVSERAVAGTLCFGVYDGGSQVGFARVVTDRAPFAYLCDVFVLASHRGKGLAKWLVECVVAHPDLRGLRRFVLLTRDAHKLYERFGFAPGADPAAYMHVHRPDPYAGRSAAAGESVGSAPSQVTSPDGP